MLSFAFSPDQQEFAEVLSDFATKELRPHYIARAASTEFPYEAFAKLGEIGVLGIGLPEEYGGTGTEDPVMLGLATEVLAAGDINLASAPIQVGLVGSQLVHSSKEVAERYLPSLIAGKETLAIALTEPGSGSDAGALRTTATPVDGGWILSGEKTAISWAMNAAATLVYARTPGTTRSSGVSCFCVPMDAEGLTRSHMLGMGCLPLGWGSIHFDDVFIPNSHLVGEEGRGFASVMNHFDFSRAAIGLMCLGSARQSLDEAVEYSQQRETFGRPISEYQGVSFNIAEQATLLEAARLVCYKALWSREANRPHTALASMSKWWPPQVARQAIEVAMRIHGNLGYAAEFPHQARYRDVMAYLVAADGSAEIQKKIIAGDIYRRGRVGY